MITLYDADRCPYCARVRIVLAEKGLEYEVIEVDLDDRPAWIYDENPLGRVPVLEEGEFVLPESAVINEYLEERWPEPALWPADPGERALGRLLVHRFDELSRPYYALRRGEEGAAERLDEQLAALAARLEAQPSSPDRISASPTSPTPHGSCAHATASASRSTRSRR